MFMPSAACLSSGGTSPQKKKGPGTAISAGSRMAVRLMAWFQSRVVRGPRGMALSLQTGQQAQLLAPAVLGKLDIETGRVLVNPEADT